MQQQQNTPSKRAPPPPPLNPKSSSSRQKSSRRSFHQKYVPLIMNNNNNANLQEINYQAMPQQEAQTQPPHSPKFQEQSKVAFVKKLSVQTHQDSKTSSMMINGNVQNMQNLKNMRSTSFVNQLQKVIQQLEQVQSQNQKLELDLRQSRMREQEMTQKLQSQQEEYRAMQDKVQNLKKQLMKLQSKVLVSEEQNTRIKEGLLDQSAMQSEIQRLNFENNKLKETLSQENSYISQQNIRLESQLRAMFSIENGNQLENYYPALRDQSSHDKIKKLQRENKQKDNYIQHLKEKLDQKQNQILTPKSSRERTPQNKSRQNWNNPELIDFQDDNQEKEDEFDQIPRRGDDLSHTEQQHHHHNNLQRIAGPSRMINFNSNNTEEQSKTPPTSHHHNYDFHLQLLNNGSSNDFIFPPNVGDSGVISMDNINSSQFQNHHQQYDFEGSNNNLQQGKLSIRIQGNGQLEPQSTFGIGNLSEALQRHDVNQQGHVTPRTNQPERKSRRGSRASTPSKDQADTPTKSSAILHQQMIHNLSNGQTISFSQSSQQQNSSPFPTPPAAAAAAAVAQVEDSPPTEQDNIKQCPNDLFS